MKVKLLFLTFVTAVLAQEVEDFDPQEYARSAQEDFDPEEYASGEDPKENFAGLPDFNPMADNLNNDIDKLRENTLDQVFKYDEDEHEFIERTTAIMKERVKELKARGDALFDMY